MRGNGQDVTARLIQLSALITCDAFFFFEQAMQSVGSLDPSGLRAAVEAVGSSYASPLTRHTTYSPTQHDGAAAYRELRFDDGCSCFAYTSDYRPLAE